MFGCIGRLISSALLLVAGAVLWQYRDRWWPQLKKEVEERLERFESQQTTPPVEKPTRIVLHVAPGIHAVIATAPVLAPSTHATITLQGTA